jgi:nucleotide-binding universal stress UspA family protein
MVPVSNPATAEDLMDLAFVVREPNSSEPLYPLAVAPPDDSRQRRARGDGGEDADPRRDLRGERRRRHGDPVTRVDNNFAAGIARAITETRASTLIVGWDGRRGQRRGIFGTVLDQVLEQTRQQVLVAKLGHPLNTTQRIVLLIPAGSDHLHGFPQAVRTIKLLTNRLGAKIEGYVVGGSVKAYHTYFDSVKPAAPVSLQFGGSWPATLQQLATELRSDDLVVVLSARRGAVSWTPALERLPARLADLAPESFVIFYPAEILAPASARASDGLLQVGSEM